MDIRRAVGAKAGVPSEKMDDLLRYRESDRFTAREQAALEYAERITRDDLEVTDACMARVREHFSEAEAVELTFIVGFQTFASKFANPITPKGCSSYPLPRHFFGGSPLGEQDPPESGTVVFQDH